tara:strand:+ start:139 stop:615 length:477 start_codon:yes stop_codon:yes gene_type:complete
MPRKQEFRRGTASYRLAKAQGRLPKKPKGKSLKKVISNIGKSLGGLTKAKATNVAKTNVGEGTVLKRSNLTGQQAIRKFQQIKSPIVGTGTVLKNNTSATNKNKNKSRTSQDDVVDFFKPKITNLAGFARDVIKEGREDAIKVAKRQQQQGGSFNRQF